jgi:competence protein ComEC
VPLAHALAPPRRDRDRDRAAADAARPPARAADRPVRLDDGRLAISPWERDAWITEQWLQSAGQAAAAPWPADGVPAGGLACDALGCILERDHRRIALARRPEALEEDCRSADLVISYPRLESCPVGGAPLIGPQALRHAQGLAVWIGRDRIETLGVRAARGARPWVR